MLFGKSVNRYYLKYWYFFLMGSFALIVVDIAQLEIPNITGLIIDEISNKTLTHEFLLESVLKLVGIIAIMFFGRFFWRMNIFNCGHRIAHDLRQRMFKKMEYLDQTDHVARLKANHLDDSIPYCLTLDQTDKVPELTIDENILILQNG